MGGISVCSTSTPWYPLDELVPKLAEAGYDGIEVGLGERRFDPGKGPDCRRNNPAVLDWAQAEDEAYALHELLGKHSLECCVVGSYVATDDIDQIAKAVTVARILGSEFIRVRAPWYDAGIGYRTQLQEARLAYRDLAMISAETGIDSLIEIHGASICASASGAMRVLEGLDPSHVGAIFDPGNYAGEGFEALPMAIDLLGPYLRHVHVKDRRVVIDEDGNDKGVRWHGESVPLGEGHIDWPRLIDLLQAAGYQGWLSIENFTGLEHRDRRLKADRAWLAGLLDAVASGA